VRGPVHPWLWRHARATRLALTAAVALGLITTGLVVAQATLLAEVVARAFLGGAGPASLRPLLLGLALVALLRAGATWAAPVVGGLAAGRVKSAVRAALTARSLRLARSDDPHSGEIATLAAEGVDAFDAYLARYLPRLALGLLAPPLVIAWVLRIDPLSGVVLLVATPLVPVFMWLAGAGAQARARRRWRELTRLGVHFLEVMRGLSTLEIFGRGRAQRQAIRAVSERYRRATMGTLRLAFLSALVLAPAAAGRHGWCWRGSPSSTPAGPGRSWTGSTWSCDGASGWPWSAPAERARAPFWPSSWGCRGRRAAGCWWTGATSGPSTRRAGGGSSAGSRSDPTWPRARSPTTSGWDHPGSPIVRCGRRWNGSGWRIGCAGSRAGSTARSGRRAACSPGASAPGWRWPGRWRAGRGCCSWTDPPTTWAGAT